MALNGLVVDDSMVMRSMIINALGLTRLAVLEIHEAANGEKALDVPSRKRLDLALVDVNTPVLDGVELLSRIRQMLEFTNLPRQIGLIRLKAELRLFLYGTSYTEPTL